MVKLTQRLLICGDRKWTRRKSIRNKLRRAMKISELTIITGGAPGADTLADEVAEELGLDRIIFPANWKGRGKAAGPIRNTKMLKDGKPTIVWAFHRDLSLSKGTRDMVKQARQSGILVIEFKK